MDTDSTNNIQDERIQQIDELKSLLERQVELIHQGDSSGKRIESLCDQADLIVQNIKKEDALKLTQFRKQREYLRKLYERLSLGVTAQKEEVAGELKLIRKGKKIIGTYRSNI